MDKRKSDIGDSQLQKGMENGKAYDENNGVKQETLENLTQSSPAIAPNRKKKNMGVKRFESSVLIV